MGVQDPWIQSEGSMDVGCRHMDTGCNCLKHYDGS